MLNIMEELKSDYNVYPFTTQFVIQEHYATSHHYDLRIKRGNVAPSWAIPKAKLPTETDKKLLAIRTEDHPLEWMRFSGMIPPGKYGAGSVNIYDRGECIVYVWTDNYIVVKLEGEKEVGFFSLIKMKKNQWLIIYMNQENAEQKYINKVEWLDPTLEENINNTTVIFYKESLPYHVLSKDNQIEFSFLLDEDLTLTEYIENTFQFKLNKITLIKEDIKTFLVGCDIEETNKSVYKVSLKEDTLNEDYTWVNVSSIKNLSENIILYQNNH